MKKVKGAKTKTGRKCVGEGQTTENQIAARRAYDRKFIRWYRRGAKGKNPAKQAAAHYAAAKFANQKTLSKILQNIGMNRGNRKTFMGRLGKNKLENIQSNAKKFMAAKKKKKAPKAAAPKKKKAPAKKKTPVRRSPRTRR